ncbi:MAG TPA: RluA family pseudouridine synthase [Thermoanaerobaculia bacterium]|nr:RluA family pseudouridine synthase [Thermoanaerobaculia bacterium]
MTAAGGFRSCWRADRGDAGGRLDLALVRHFAGVPGLSRSQVQGWIGAGRVRVNGAEALRPAGRLAAGDELEVELSAPPPSRGRSRALAAQRLPLAILYEDEHLLALDKPAGLVVHPTGRYRDGTLANALAWYLGEGAPVAAAGQVGAQPSAGPAASEAPAVRVGLVHRLDRDTSGVLLVAKSRAAHAGLARAIKARALHKDYLALVYGRAPLARGRIELKLRHDPHDRRRVAASRTEGLNAVTLYELLAETCPGAGGKGRQGVWLSLLRCRLVTGRTHQIRVHLAAVGLPIVGDPVYGEPRHRGLADPVLAELCRAFPRQALHAWRLGLRHPVTGRQLALAAPVPADLAGLLRAAGQPAGDEQLAALAAAPRR